MYTSMQPLHCDLHPLVAEHRGGTDWPRNDPSRTCRTQEVPFIAGCSHFTRKNTRFRAPTSSPKTAPCNIHAAIAMRFCSTTYTSMQPLECDLHPPVAEHGRNRLTSKKSNPQPPHTGGTFHRRLQPLYTEKHTVLCSGFFPKTDPMQHSCSHYNAFCSTMYTSMQAAITMRFAVSHHPLLNVFLCDFKPHTTLHECILMWCKASHHPSLSVLLCDVKSHTTLHWVYCYVMSSLTPPFSECIVMWCQVSHHPSLSVLLCDVKSHTTLHWVYCYVMSRLTPPFIECIVMWCQVSHHPSSGKSHA